MNRIQVDRRQFMATAAVSALAAPQLLASRIDVPSRKKGFCTVTQHGSDWQKKIAALNAKWFYSWGANLPADVPDGVEFCPMIWGGGEESIKKKCAAITDLIADDKVRYVMGFNEPDQREQSNLTVEQAIDWWPMLMELNVPLVSPGCVHPDREWMKQFMAEVDRRNYRVDYVSVHSYAGPSVDGLINRLKAIHNMYGRPIWITEFAVGDWKAATVEENRHAPEQIARFMAKLLPQLEKADFIDRYAWFSAAPSSAALGTSALFDASGNLTNLGEIYARHAPA